MRATRHMTEKKHKVRKTLDMTQGAIPVNLLLFMLPIAGSSIFQQLYNTADFMFVGNFLTMTVAAAVGASSSIVNLLIGLFTGLSVGVNVHAARGFGEKDAQKLSKVLHTAITFSLATGFLLLALGIPLAPQILRALNTPAQAEREAVLYLRIYLLSLPFMVIYNMGAAFCRGKGDSATPFHILVICGFVNVVMDWLLIVVIPLGVAGVSIATAISQGLSAVLILRSLAREEEGYRFGWHKMGIDLPTLKKILGVGLPAGVQAMVITFSNIIVQYYINGLGAVSVAAFAVYYKLENFIFLPILAVGQASTTFCAQNFGAGKPERIKKGTWLNLGMGVMMTVLIAGIILAFPHPIFRLFMKDEAVIEQAILIGRISFAFYWIYDFIEVFGGAIRGMGRSVTSMTVILSTLCGARILLLYIFAHTDYSLRRIATVYPITWAMAGGAFMFIFLRVMRKKQKNTGAYAT